MSARLFTIGYEIGGQASLIETLKAAGVAQVIDVREIANSRRAGLSKSSLRASLAAAGMHYVHLRALGTPKAGREANKKGRMGEFWAIVTAALERPEAGLALQEAAALALERPTALLCLEADPCRCHRLEVAHRLGALANFEIVHLAVTPI